VTGAGSSFPGEALSLLLRSSLLLALLLGPALLLDRARLRAARQHAVLLVVLIAAALAPVWLALAARLPANSRHQNEGKTSRAQLLADEAAPAVASPVRSVPMRVAQVWAGRPPWLAPALLGIWAGGLLLGMARIAHGLIQVQRLRRRARRFVTGPAGAAEDVLICDDVDAALAVGIVTPVVLLADALARTPGTPLDQILAHERAHLRRRDPLTGLLQRLVASVYWFHPLVHLVSRQLARLREDACDDAVIARHDRVAYAHTLVALTTAVAPPALDAAMRIQTGIEHRIRRIVAPVALAPDGVQRGTMAAVIAGVLLFGGRGAAALALSRPASALSPAALPSTDSPPVQISVLPADQAVFHRASPRAEGAFVLFDLQERRHVVLNPTLAQQRLTPASTFKLIIALVALETGAAPDQSFRLRWDGQRREMDGWNQDLDLGEAMRLSATWYFDQLLARLDHDQVARVLRDIGYGNADASGDPREFWVDGTLQTSAFDQVAVMAQLSAGGLGVGARTHAILRSITRLAERGGAVMYGKTGTAFVGAEGIAWLVGHVEWQGRRFAYATLMRAPAADCDRLRQHRLEVTRTLLVQQGAFPAE
jgi:bla regulator protein BlaR1